MPAKLKTCCICNELLDNCVHTDADRRKHEEDLAWEAHKASDPEWEDDLKRAMEQDLDENYKDGTYRRP